MELRRFTRLSKTCHITMFEYLQWWSCSWKVLFSRCGKCKCIFKNKLSKSHIPIGSMPGMVNISIHIIYQFLVNFKIWYHIYIYINFWWSPFYHILFIYHRSLQICLPKMFVNQVVGRLGRHLSRPKKKSRLLGLVCEHLAWSGMPSRPWHAMTGTP